MKPYLTLTCKLPQIYEDRSLYLTSCLVLLPFGYIISKTLRYRCFLSPICELCNREKKSLSSLIFIYFFCLLHFSVFFKTDPLWCHRVHWYPSQVSDNTPSLLFAQLSETTCPLSPYKHVIPDSTNQKAKTHCFLWKAVNKGLNMVFWRSVFFY